MGSKQVRSIDAADVEQTMPTSSEMSHRLPADATEVVRTDDRLDSVSAEIDDPRSVELSEPFVNRWSVLISRTNWEKGSIICAWRSELERQGAPASAYSDEAWSRRVGGVTSQHVGRLRRVYQRFGEVYSSYARLYWTHFLAALDWDDAEMWLEGASQSEWSVSEMRGMRWQASGGDPSQQPSDGELSNVSLDEDVVSTSANATAVDHDDQRTKDRSNEIVEGPRYEGPDFGDEGEPANDRVISAEDAQSGDDWEDMPGDGPQVSPFASLPSLPVDVAESLEQMKLAIIRHRASSWTEISQADMLRTIEALRQFASQS